MCKREMMASSSSPSTPLPSLRCGDYGNDDDHDDSDDDDHDDDHASSSSASAPLPSLLWCGGSKIEVSCLAAITTMTGSSQLESLCSG